MSRHYTSLSIYFNELKWYLLAKRMEKKLMYDYDVREPFFFFQGNLYEKKYNDYFSYIRFVVERGICLVLQLAFCYVAMILSHLNWLKEQNLAER